MCAPHRATHTASGILFHPPAFDERPRVLRDQGWCEARHDLASTVVAVVLRLPVVNVPSFLRLGGLALGARIAAEHGVLWTATGGVTVLGSTVTPKSVDEHYLDSTTQPISCSQRRIVSAEIAIRRWPGTVRANVAPLQRVRHQP